MDLIKSLIADKGGELVSQLIDKSGFSTEQAEAFVPEAFSSVVDAVKGGANPEDEGGLLEQIDIGNLASKVGIDTEAASGGLSTILPMVMSLLGEKAGGLGALTSLLGGGDGIAGKLTGLAGGLLNR